MIVKHPGCMYLIFCTGFGKFFHGCIQIDHQLKLQAVIDAGQIKPGIPAFIVHHPDIRLSVPAAHIDPVDPPLQTHPLFSGQDHGYTGQLLQIPKGNLCLLRHKSPLLQLL